MSNKLNNNNKENKTTLELKLGFESIFNPKSVHNLRILTSTRSLSNVGHYKLKKVLVKQSYLLIF